jgi:hypothetical protein
MRVGITMCALAAAAGGMTVSAPSASALGYNAWLCGQDNQWAGQSTATNGGSTKNLGTCGTASVRLFYQLYPGSPTYYTGWVSGNPYAYKSNPGNTVLGGNHKVASCGWFYDCGPNNT